MKTDHLDTIIGAIRTEAVDPAVAEQAAQRVRARLFASDSGSGGPMNMDRLRTCADFQALIPAYLNRSLAPAKSLLLVDHTHACVACRRALETARSGNVRILQRPQAVSSQVSPMTKWAVAAMVALGVGVGTFAMVRSMLVSPGARATVQNVNGILYQVADASSTPVFAGRELGERQTVRTPKQSTAMLRLTDGSMLEVNERSQLSVSQASRGITIHLDRGSVIVHAAKQHTGALYVKTADCEVKVKGTIFAVTSGTKGSRVSVVEGSVQVDQASKSVLLKPGDQTTTDASVERVPVQDEVAWSRDSAKYMAALGELSGLQKQIEQIPGPGLRTSSKLLDYVPANTVLYAAIPNIGGTLGEANRLFQDRIQSSPVLQEWWSEHSKNGVQLQDLIQKIQTASSYLGDEIVLAVSADQEGRPTAPMILAEAKRDGLREFLQAEMPHAGKAQLYVNNGIVAIAGDSAKLQELAGHFQQDSGIPSFTDTSFHARISQAYQSGVGWLFCANLGQMTRHLAGNAKERRSLLNSTGMNGMQYLILERKDVNGDTNNQATLVFAGQRQGLASWLAAPGPMSTLDFVSPDANLATSFVIQNPGALLSQLISQAEANSPEFQQKLNEFQNQTGVSLINDVADGIGGELTFAIDGPVVPVPSWKLAVEVTSPDRLEWAFERFINAFNQQPGAPFQLQLTKAAEASRTFYTIKPSGGNAANFPVEIDYVFVDGYLLAAANRNLLNTAIQNRSTGYTLAKSEKFRNLLPHDANSNFSGIVYHNVGGLVGPLVSNLKSMNAMTPGQKQAIDTLQANSAPGLIYAYADTDRIQVAANGSLFGFSLDSLALPKAIQNMMRQKQ